MSRTTIIVLIALGATFAGFVLASNAQRLSGDDPAAATSVAAGPQSAELDWRETYGEGRRGARVHGRPSPGDEDRLGGDVGSENGSSVGWELVPTRRRDGTFGLQLFDSGDPEEFAERNRERTLPAVRAATRFEPELPPILEPGATWEGTMSARGALVAGASARVVFGTLIAVGKPPKELYEKFDLDHRPLVRAASE